MATYINMTFVLDDYVSDRAVQSIAERINEYVRGLKDGYGTIATTEPEWEYDE
jgi:hypothetical protein